MPLRSVFPCGEMGQSMEVIVQVIARFADGQLTVDQFVKELDAKALMMFKEGN